jgi:hypothetical protein
VEPAEEEKELTASFGAKPSEINDKAFAAHTAEAFVHPGGAIYFLRT